MGINGVEDVTFAYDPANLPADPSGQSFLVGAENALGQGDMAKVLPTGDLRVTTSDSVLNGFTYSFVIHGARHGLATVSTRMQVGNVPDVVVAESLIEVTKK
jgi:hypothetical protein